MSLTKDLEIMYNRALIVMEGYVASNATSLEGYMKRNAKWDNHTGDARRRLKGTYQKQDDGFLIILSHGVDYGIFLELAHEKRFAITVPTAKEKGPEIMKEFEGLLDKLKNDIGI